MPLQMFTDGEECVIAESAEDVRAILSADRGQDEDEREWRTLGSDESFDFDHDDARGVETKTVAEWIAEHGRGYFAGPI